MRHVRPCLDLLRELVSLKVPVLPVLMPYIGRVVNSMVKRKTPSLSIFSPLPRPLCTVPSPLCPLCFPPTRTLPLRWAGKSGPGGRSGRLILTSLVRPLPVVCCQVVVLGPELKPGTLTFQACLSLLLEMDAAAGEVGLHGGEGRPTSMVRSSGEGGRVSLEAGEAWRCPNRFL